MVLILRRNKVFTLILCMATAGLLCFAQIKANTSLILMSLLLFLILVVNSTIKNFSLPVLLFYLPWCKILSISPTSYSFFTIALLCVCVINIFIHKFKVEPYQLFVGLSVSVLTLLSKILHMYELSLSYIMFLLMLVLFPLVKKEQKSNTYDFFMLVVFLSAGVIMASLCAQEFSAYGNIIKYIRVDNYLAITRRCGFYGDPNFYNAQVTAAIAGCMVLILQLKDGRKIALLGALLMILIYCGLLSGSKSFLLVFLVMLLLWFFQLGKMRGRSGTKMLLIIAILMFSLYVSTSVIFGDLIEVIMTRFSFANNVSDFTTGRTELWQMYFEYLMGDWKAFLLGVGCTNVKVNGYASHSTIIQMWYQVGVIGIIPLLFWCVFFMKDSGQKSWAGAKIFVLILVIGVFVPWLAIDMLFFDEFFVFPMYVLVGLKDCGELYQYKRAIS